jgi:hypothetical protein
VTKRQETKPDVWSEIVRTVREALQTTAGTVRLLLVLIIVTLSLCLIAAQGVVPSRGCGTTLAPVDSSGGAPAPSGESPVRSV